MEVNVTLVQLVYHDAASHLPTSECFHRVFPNWAVKAKKNKGRKIFYSTFLPSPYALRKSPQRFRDIFLAL